jgi:hypothetical protein
VFPFHLFPDTSDHQLGAFILHYINFITYYSRKLNPAQKRDSPTEMEKELISTGGSIIVIASKAQRVCFGWCPYYKWTHQIHTNHDPGMQRQILLFWVEAAHISYFRDLSLSFDILDKWSINNQCSTSCVSSDHVIVFLIVFSVLF